MQQQCQLWQKSLNCYIDGFNVISLLLHANQHATAHMAEASPSRVISFGLSVLSASDCAVKSELNATAKILAYAGVKESFATAS